MWSPGFLCLCILWHGCMLNVFNKCSDCVLDPPATPAGQEGELPARPAWQCQPGISLRSPHAL